MANTPSKVRPVLSSDWMGLSKHLIASFYEVKRISGSTNNDKAAKWGAVEGETDPVIVKAPLTDANMEIALNWQSPFESAGPESKAPALFAMLQSGALQPVVDRLMGKGAGAAAAQKSDDFLKQFEGRTGITKLNSTQVFNGMPPVKITVSALFRAWSDPSAEVEQPFDKLMEWALPAGLAGDSTVLTRAADTTRGNMGLIEALMPSKAPVMVAMQYKGRTYSPLVIESIGHPMNSPIDKSGRYVELLVPMTLCTLTAIDRGDWSNFRRVEM